MKPLKIGKKLDIKAINKCSFTYSKGENVTTLRRASSAEKLSNRRIARTINTETRRATHLEKHQLPR